ncbi:MAG: lipid IV(A) 3-deoxy-D-manno-octulosonic acid transferase [Gammaproteobacteria bacterium]|nr:lipid IV(A) 3-deoxy-D-manno-octulosonic acid transferase [Gammaproteobacteria bacterium]MBU1624009.1 lipid IV(A) 3-deoxy-D-manno-octulosonic acid transferase [Gammaproteobacteria bacterium]MBU1981737.1 lipid IV(A) 3-deoxy-D-manno-octulosonic acid transferase [Gammaproteobacteria bacterium]
MKIFDTRHAYTLLLWLLLPYALLHLLWRARKQPEYLRHIGERFGHYRIRSDKPVIWLHTVSVGETRAAATLVREMRERYPQHQILLTHTTPTGRTASEQLYGDDVLRAYLPYDYPFAVRRFLQHFRPQVGVLLETEVWFNLIHACQRTNTPLLLLNARLSERSARKYARYPQLTHDGLHALKLIAAQTEDDALRLTSLSGRSVTVMGNLKFDIAPPPAQLELGQHLRARFGETRPVFLAASTREGEEALLLEALKHADIEHLLTVIVPRHPQRFDAVASLVEQHGFRLQRRSANEAVAAETQVVLGDSMGELFAYYRACDIAFIGGSLLPLGGQNLIEACAASKPVLLGPHTFNFDQVAESALTCGAALRVRDAHDLVHQLRMLMHDAGRMQEMGQQGERFVSGGQGATERAMTLIEQNLKEKAPEQ